MSSAAPTVKAALVAAITTAVNDASVLVCYGPPGLNQPNDIVAVLGVDSASDQAPQTLDRSRTETLLFSIVVSCYRPGEGTQQTATERCYTLLGAIEQYVKVTAPTLGGLVWGDGFVSAHTLAEQAEKSETGSIVGRTSEIAATIQLHATI